MIDTLILLPKAKRGATEKDLQQIKLASNSKVNSAELNEDNKKKPLIQSCQLSNVEVQK